MLVRDTFKLAWLTYHGFRWIKMEVADNGKFQYLFEGTDKEKKCLRQYGSNATMPVKELKEEIQLNQYRSQESTTNERNNIIN